LQPGIPLPSTTDRMGIASGQIAPEKAQGG
jgi:hypothetical protein